MTDQTAHYYSNGKLLLTGEYLIMYGAKSLAIPVKFGQSMDVVPNKTGEIKWEARIQGFTWFKVIIKLPDLQLIEWDDNEKSEYLITVLKKAKEMNPGFLIDGGVEVTTNLNYPQKWGLGSSSTFIANVASWSQVDPMLLNKAISNGSGYDIACAKGDSAILFQISNQKPAWKEVKFVPAFSEYLYFVYLGKKQNSQESVRQFKHNYSYKQKDMGYISGLTDDFINSQSIQETMNIMEQHESYLSVILQLPPVKQTIFPDFNGSIKSLGAWGGDFVMAASAMSFEGVNVYFREKGFETIFSFKEMVLNSSF